jgi:DtxR family Mn-dependent transcriptional regulator
MTKLLSASVEDYLKTIHELELECEGARVSTSALAERMQVANASATGMLKKLAAVEPQLVDYKPYSGVRLTEAGEKIAREVLRHHRLIETYLIEALGFSWHEVHDEADQLEHVISEALEARIAEYLGHPEVDPHGDPIPTLEGELLEDEQVSLNSLEPGQRGQVIRVVDDQALLQYLDELEIELSSIVEVIHRAPFEGPLHIQVEGKGQEHAVSPMAAGQIFVRKL